MEKKEVLFEQTAISGNKESTFIQYKDGDMIFRVSELEESQLDRIERKLDRILELLEDKELSNSVEINSIKVGEITNEMIEKYNLERFGYSKNSTPGFTSL